MKPTGIPVVRANEWLERGITLLGQARSNKDPDAEAKAIAILDSARIKTSNVALVGTHDGAIHADELFAVASLCLLHEPLDKPSLSLIRSRDPTLLDQCDWLVDVGGEHDDGRHKFDHHQRGGAGIRPDKPFIPYAAFGLTWKAVGEEVTQRIWNDLQGGKPQDEQPDFRWAASRVDQRFCSWLDASDGGIKRPGVGLPQILSWFNPVEIETWQDTDQIFVTLLGMAVEMLRRCIIQSLNEERSVRPFLDLLAEVPLGQKWIEMPTKLKAPTKLLLDTDLEFVIKPVKDRWAGACLAVLNKFGQFRRLFPQAWRGLAGAELQAASKIPSAIFCHQAGHLMWTGTREDLLTAIAACEVPDYS